MSLLFTWDKIVLKFKDTVSQEIGDFLFYNSQIRSTDDNIIIIQVDTLAISLLKNDKSKNFITINNILKDFFGQEIQLKFITKDYVPQIQENSDQKLNTIDTNYSYQQTNLIINLNFENYFYSYDNRTAIEACKAVINDITTLNKDLSFNPIFFHGASGIGKTHLVNAIGNEIFKIDNTKKILYTGATEFLNEYSNLFKGGLNNTNKLDEFKQKYFNLDVFIIDDVQMLKTKEATLNEFFSIFEHLRLRNKMVIITSDINPKELNFAPRLLTRFLSGLVQTINLPDSDTKTHIFNYHAHQSNLNIDEDAINIFIESSKQVRELLGYLNSIKADLITSGIDSKIDKQKAIEIVSRLTNTSSSFTKADIINIVCNYFEVEFEDLLKKSRKQIFVVPRNFCIYFLKTRLNITFKMISVDFKMKDHTNCVKIVKNFEVTKTKHKKAYDIISQNINNFKR